MRGAIILTAVLSILITANCRVIKPDVSSKILISRLEIYEQFQIVGYSTAGAWSNFDKLRENNIAKTHLSKEQVEELNESLLRADKFRHFQSKLGTYNIFCLAEIENKVSRCLISGGEDHISFIDLTNRLEFVIHDSVGVPWMMDLMYDKYQVNRKPD